MEPGRFSVVLLTAFGVLTRRQVAECTVWTTVIVIAPPIINEILGMGDRFVS